MSTKEENIDYLAELIVSQLIANKGIERSDIQIYLLGIFKRFFSNDVEKIDAHKSSNGRKKWDVYIHREGLYDLLPEGLFHGHSHKYFKDRKETVQEFRRHRIEEFNARHFFMPLEQEFFNQLVSKEIFEQNFYYSPEYIREFIDFFNLDQLGLNVYQQSALFFILPHIPKITGNLDLTETCFEIILQEQVNLIPGLNPQILFLDNHDPELNKSFLGVNSILGNVCIDHNPGLLIRIGPLQNPNTLKFYIEGRYKELVNRLIEFFIQADISTEIEVLLDKVDDAFLLSDSDYEGRLNYSATI